MIRALTFDTYGTVVDWRTSVLDELRALADRKVLRLDSVLFLDEWKAAYRPGMDDVNRGTRPWTTIDAIYRRPPAARAWRRRSCRARSNTAPDRRPTSRRRRRGTSSRRTSKISRPALGAS